MGRNGKQKVNNLQEMNCPRLLLPWWLRTSSVFQYTINVWNNKSFRHLRRLLEQKTINSYFIVSLNIHPTYLQPPRVPVCVCNPNSLLSGVLSTKACDSNSLPNILAPSQHWKCIYYEGIDHLLETKHYIPSESRIFNSRSVKKRCRPRYYQLPLSMNHTHAICLLSSECRCT
jgi:hypothetical protein